LGVEVDVYERSPAELAERGAGIGVLPESARYLVDRPGRPPGPTRAASHLPYLDRRGDRVYDGAHAYRFSSWNTVYRTLKARLAPARYHLGHEMTGWTPTDEAIGNHLASPTPRGGAP